MGALSRSSLQSFAVTVTEQAPVLNAPANQSISHNQTSLLVNLAGSDPDGVTLTYTAQALSTSQHWPLTLKQSLGLTFTGNYWTNYFGDQEKWLLASRGPSGAGWYCLLPDGELRKAGTSSTAMLAAGSLVATLDSSFYQDPSLLWNAQAGVATFPSRLTVTRQSAHRATARQLSSATFKVVQVTVSDGALPRSSKSFSVAVTNAAPVLNNLVNLALSQSQNQGSLGLQLSPFSGRGRG